MGRNNEPSPQGRTLLGSQVLRLQFRRHSRAVPTLAPGHALAVLRLRPDRAVAVTATHSHLKHASIVYQDADVGAHVVHVSSHVRRKLSRGCQGRQVIAAGAKQRARMSTSQ